MDERRSIPRAAARFAWVLPALVWYGCSASEYNELVAKRADEMVLGQQFQGLFQPVQLGEVPISIRVPMVFSKSYTEDSEHKDDGDKIAPERFQPPFMTLPGLKMCFEGTGKAGSMNLPFYCYLAAQPSRPGDLDKVAADLVAQLKEKYPDAPLTWEEVDCASPDGTSKHWKKLRVVGDQPFRVKQNGKVADERLQGIFELWLFDAEQHVVIVGWRAPTAIEGPTEPPPAGTIVNPLTNQPTKPDLARQPALTAGTVKLLPPAAE